MKSRLPTGVGRSTGSLPIQTNLLNFANFPENYGWETRFLGILFLTESFLFLTETLIGLSGFPIFQDRCDIVDGFKSLF